LLVGFRSCDDLAVAGLEIEIELTVLALYDLELARHISLPETAAPAATRGE
jgi:hypothetical protein